jgi:Transposase DDE domain group 1
VDAADGAVEEVSRIVRQIRRRWPKVRILLRADSGFARDGLMAWCEANGVHFVFGLPKNDRLIAAIKGELTIRLKLLTIGALVSISVRRIKIAMASGCPLAITWRLAAARLAAAANARASPA